MVFCVWGLKDCALLPFACFNSGWTLRFVCPIPAGGDRTGMKLENKWRDTGENNSETVVTPCNSNILDKPLNLIAP